MLYQFLAVLLLAFGAESVSLPSKRTTESRTCTFETPMALSPPGPVPESSCNINFGNGVLVRSADELQFFALDGVQGVGYISQTTGSFTPIYPGAPYKSIKPQSFRFLCTLRGPAALLPGPIASELNGILNALALLGDVRATSAANVPQSCDLTVTATFLDNTSQQHTCSFAPDSAIAGISIPKLTDIVGASSQRLADCILPSSWQNVKRVDLLSAAGYNIPDGSTLSSSILFDTLKYVGYT